MSTLTLKQLQSARKEVLELGIFSPKVDANYKRPIIEKGTIKLTFAGTKVTT